MLAVVELPVAGQDPPLALQAAEERRVRERRDDGEARKVDLRLHGEARRLQEHIGSVVVQAEHEATLERDAVAMQRLHQLAEALGAIEPLPAVGEVRRVNRLQANQEPPAAAAGDELQERAVVGQEQASPGRTTAPPAGSGLRRAGRRRRGRRSGSGPRRSACASPCCRMSATTSSTGFWYGRVPQAVGTTQNSQWWTQPRVASKTSLVMKRRLGSRSRRGERAARQVRSGAWS